MNIVFLDIDGVLNSLPYMMSLGKGPHGKFTEIDRRTLPLLREIVLGNNAKIVLSSTWRDLADYDESAPDAYEMYQYLVNSLKEFDMEIFDRTPVNCQERPREILEWLEAHSDESIKWISLDDDFDESSYSKVGLARHLVKTKYFTYDINEGGLQRSHVDLANQLFKKQEDIK